MGISFEYIDIIYLDLDVLIFLDMIVSMGVIIDN